MANMNNDDKVYEAYTGKLGLDMQVKLKKRFSWMAKGIKGEKVLDVGCSQGIFDILLAKENKQVTGLDIFDGAIKKANALKEELSTIEKENVRFELISFGQFKTTEKYDTVIFGEVLEHQYYPEKFIEKAFSMLTENGSLIITLPFGINDYFDHRKDYYLFDIIQLLEGKFKIEDVTFLDEWIGINAKKSSEPLSSTELMKILSQFEKHINVFERNNKLLLAEAQNASYKSERRFKNSQQEIKDQQKTIEDLTLTCEALRKQITLLNNRKAIRWIRNTKWFAKKLNYRTVKNKAHSLVNKVTNKKKHIHSINMEFYNNIDSLIANIPDTNGCSYFKKYDIKIGIITDEYMYNYYKDAVHLIYVNYENYKGIIDEVDLLLFVSCWKGMKNNDWRGISGEAVQEKLFEIVDYLKSQGKKFLFQTIEDPSNYELYIPIAKKADYIFTTDSDKIEDYKKDTNNDKVFLLTYGVNPLFHNPIGFRVKNEYPSLGVFFAGSWAPRYKERCNDSMMLFDGVLESKENLVLADRNYDITGYEFPNKYLKYIIPSIPHEKLQKVHKLFDWSLNLNSIKYSPTMCAMRIYELQALGVLMISNYSMAVNNVFPSVFTVHDKEEVKNILNTYSDLEKYKMQVEGIRNVMSHYTVFDRLNFIFSIIGREDLIQAPKKVLVVCNKKTSEIITMFENQTYQDKVLMTVEEAEKESSHYDYVAFFKETINYQKHYLEDMMNAFKYTDVSYVTIQSDCKEEIIGPNYVFVDQMLDQYKTIFDLKKIEFSAIKNGLQQTGFSLDPFNIIEEKEEALEPLLSVIVPIYNNGKHLKGKCFASLKRSSMFKNMEIILVDDGSTNSETIDIIKELEQNYSNVKIYQFDDGGSGTASRPRNKGVELSTAPYITYLDPDNEAINDGYRKLYEKIKDSNYDFVFGSIIKLSDKEVTIRYISGNHEFTDPRSTLITNNFKPQSIQACVIKKSLITENKIINPVGAAGQDSLFFQEMMNFAHKVYHMDLPIHIYYAAREGSVVNSISHRFFEKFLILEKYQVKRLKELDLYDEYIKRRYTHFLNNWYLAKYELVKDEHEKELSLKIIKEIEALYDK